jgi:uncharacterized protein YchJ
MTKNREWIYRSIVNFRLPQCGMLPPASVYAAGSVSASWTRVAVSSDQFSGSIDSNSAVRFTAFFQS